MTEQEAITMLFQQCAPPTGFLVRLRQGQGLDQQGVQQLWRAFDALQQVWSERTCVPREAVLALAYFDEVLLQVMFEQYPQHEDELEELQMALIERLPALLMSGSLPKEWDTESVLDTDFLWFWEHWAERAVIPGRPLTEAEALAVLRKHLVKGDGLIVALRCRSGACHKLGMAKAWFLLSQALETLRPVWEAAPCIPKDIALGLAQVRDGIVNGWTLYDGLPTIQQGLLVLANDLGAKVLRCLQGNSVSSQGLTD